MSAGRPCRRGPSRPVGSRPRSTPAGPGRWSPTRLYSPSLTAYSNLRRHASRQAKGEFLGFGDPEFGAGGKEGGEAIRRFAARGLPLRRLRHSRDEVEGIAATFGERAAARLGAEATERRAKSEASGYRHLHFATHGLLDDQNPLYSGLALSPPEQGDEDSDDLLQVWEMFGLRLAADLVVCSACETGRGRIHEGEGLVGMSRALFFAGARCAVVSLWSVPDAATAELMQRLYRHLRSGEPVAEALRRAKAELPQDRPDRADPYFWAAFVAVGLGW